MLLARVANPDSATLTIDLPSQTIEAPGMMALSFSIGEARKHNLIAGVDHVGQALGRAEDIRSFEAQQNDARRWMWSRGRSI